MLPNIDSASIYLSLEYFLPELVLCFGVVVLLVCRLFKAFDRTHMGGIALALTLLALVFSVLQWIGVDRLTSLSSDLGWFALKNPAKTGALLPFGGLLIYDYLTIFLRIFLYACTALVIWLSLVTGIPDREDSADFYTLLLGAVIGMAIMASSGHLIMVFIGVEMASLPSYALAGFLKGKRQSSEAALKYVVYGGGAAGIMLYGISLLAGKYGTGYLPDLAMGMVQSLGAGEGLDPLLVLGVLFILIGVGFKVSAGALPFLWPRAL